MTRKRFLRVGLIVGGVLVVLSGGFLWALPEILRRVALDQVPKRTGRAVAIEDIDLNIFTGHLAIKKLRLAERDGSEAFVELERADVRLSLLALLRSDVRLREVAVLAPSIRVVRTGAAEFNFSDLAGPGAPPPEESKPSGWTFTIDRLMVSRGAVRAQDRAVTPAAEWVVQDLGIDAAGLTTKVGAAPGRLAVHAKIDDAVLDVAADPLRLEPLTVSAKVALDGFEVARVNPYVFAERPYRPTAGRIGLVAEARVDSDARELKTATLSGAVTIDGPAISLNGSGAPFLDVSRLAVELKQADAITRTLTVASVTLEGVDLKARRDPAGVIDLVDVLLPKKAEAAPAPTRASPAHPATVGAEAPPGTPAPTVERKLFPVLRAISRGFTLVTVEKIALTPSRASLVDEAVTPHTTLALTKLQATVDDFTWPAQRPARLSFSTALPGGGTLVVKGPVIAQPLDADLAFTLRNAPVAPYQAYIPIPARMGGRFSGDSRNHIALKSGALTLASRGNSWAQDVVIRAPGIQSPVMRVDRMDVTGIDFDWPKHARVARITIRKPEVRVERADDGSINLRQLFTAAAPADGAAAEPKPPPAPKTGESAAVGDRPKSLLDTIALDFKEIRVEQGMVRFLDRTTTPAFSQDLSRLNVTVTGLGNRPGQRAKLALQSVVGGDAGLDMRGEIGALGAPAFVDVLGELRAFKLASVDPYAEAAIGWVIKKGELQYKLHFKLEGDELAVKNDVVVGQLQVAPSSGGDEVKQRIGLPLNLIVALIKDGNGDIKANVPVTGSVDDPTFDLRETIWTAVKNVLVNIVKAPFRMIGRLFSSGDKLEVPQVDPVVFAPGSSVLGPDMEAHLLRVADFLRRSPFVNLALATAPSDADAEALRSEAVAERLRTFQKARGLKDAAATLAAYFKERLPDVKPPATVEAQLALLKAREPLPEPQLADLARRRLAATRERLTTVEGIPVERLVVAEPKAEGAEPKAEGAEPRIEGAGPKAEGGAPKAEGAEPKAEGAEPRIEGAGSKAEGGAPKVEGAEPKAESAGPKAEGGEATPEGGGQVEFSIVAGAE